MTCSDVQRTLPEVLDGDPSGVVANEFETHLKSCPECSDLLSDLKLIASEARQLAATEEPSPRVWLGVAAQLSAEGLIHDSKPAASRPILVPAPASPSRRWSAWWLAPVAAGLVAAGSYVVSHKPAPQVARQQAPAPTVPVTTSVTETPADSSVSAPLPQQTAKSGVAQSAPPRVILGSAADNAIDSSSNTEPSTESSTEDQQFLRVVGTRAPSMRATYENQLKAVNADIRETQAYVKRNPGDADARQHLMDAYQQKALLYQIGLDRIQ
jgi:hypothetical protein